MYYHFVMPFDIEYMFVDKFVQLFSRSVSLVQNETILVFISILKDIAPDSQYTIH